MATITLYNMSKRQNSTALPSGTGNVRTGEFNQPLDLLNPSITVEGPSSLIAGGYNYAYVPSLRRYYWITGITALSDRLAEISLAVDVLATYKTEIGNSSQYVMRSAAASNGMLTDDLYPISNANVDSDEDISTEIPWWMLNPGEITDGYYVIGIVNDDASAIGASSYYVFDQTGFSNLRNILLDDVSYTGMTFADLEEPLYKSLFNPFQYFTSCVWFPLKPPTTAMSSLQWNIGWFPITPLAGHVWKLDGTIQYTLSGALQTINHPQISEGGYFQHAPFTQRKLIVQPFGEIPLDCSKINDINHVLKLQTWIDFVTGDIVLRVINTTEGNAICGSAAGKLGVPIQLAQISQNLLGAAGGVINALGGAAQLGSGLGTMTVTGGAMGGDQFISGVQNTANGVISAVEAFMPSVGAAGMNGSLLSTVVTPIYHTQFYLSVIPNNTLFGKPLCETRTVNTLSANGGFVKCQNAHIAISGALPGEIVAVETALNTGFFYE